MPFLIKQLSILLLTGLLGVAAAAETEGTGSDQPSEKSKTISTETQGKVTSPAKKAVNPPTQKVDDNADKQSTEQPEHTTAPVNVEQGSAYAELLSEILSILKDKHPDVLRKVNENRELFVNDILRALQFGCHYQEKEPADTSMENGKSNNDKKKGKTTVYAAIMIAANKILYIRIDSFSQAAYDKLKEDLLMSANLAKRPQGLILDLRNCHGFNLGNALRALSLICPEKNLPSHLKSYKLEKQVYGIPCAVLIGRHTSGAAETFADYLSKLGKSVSLGGKSAGKPFPVKSIALKHGGFFYYPDIPEFYAKDTIVPIQPEIEAGAYPQVSYEDISGKSGVDHGDKCLQRASDLLISIEALKQKKVKPVTKAKQAADKK